MRALREILRAAQAAGLEFDLPGEGHGLPDYLSDAVAAVSAEGPQAAAADAAQTAADAADAADADRPPAGGAEPAADAARPARRLVVAARPAPVRPGDWLVIDLPTGEAAIPVRALAKELALAGAQAYELVRLGGGQVILVAHGVARPEAVGPALDPVPGSRPWLEAGPAASDAEILAACNATVLGPAQNSGAAAAMAQRYLAEVAPLRDRLADRAAELQARAERAEADVERLKGELTARYAREDALRARLARGPWYRLRRKLGRIAARRRAS